MNFINHILQNECKSVRLIYTTNYLNLHLTLRCRLNLVFLKCSEIYTFTSQKLLIKYHYYYEQYNFIFIIINNLH